MIKEVSLRRPLFCWQASNVSKASAGRIGRMEGEAKKEQAARGGLFVRVQKDQANFELYAPMAAPPRTPWTIPMIHSVMAKDAS